MDKQHLGPGLHFLVAKAGCKDMPWSLWASRASGLSGRNRGPFADPTPPVEQLSTVFKPNTSSFS